MLYCVNFKKKLPGSSQLLPAKVEVVSKSDRRRRLERDLTVGFACLSYFVNSVDALVSPCMASVPSLALWSWPRFFVMSSLLAPGESLVLGYSS